jgi:asparagine synthase (glutamine-hydrolysing)
MCGVAGIVDFAGAPVDRARVVKMTRLLAHRGPDDEGFYFDSVAGIGHRRLSIVDLTAAGRQPMTNESRTIWVAFNGEIYNFRELRAELQTKGHLFVSHSDTEVIVHGYEEWGDDCWRRLDGFFAIVLWDANAQELRLVRDAFGIKPLLYWFDGRTAIFGSEIKALLGSGLVAQEQNPQALSDYLTYFYVPGAQTILRDVWHVPPAHFVVLDGAGAMTRRFWQLEVQEPLGGSEEAIWEQLRHECRVAVLGALESDVPIGLLLSAGLDSNIILRELVDAGRREVNSITVGFRQESFDESAIAQRVLAELRMAGDCVYVEEQPLSAMFDRMVYHTDSLNANPANLAEYNIFQATASKVRVALAGMGNDELFAGYATYRADRLRRIYRRFPMPLRRLARAMAWRLPPSERKYGLDHLARKFTEGAEFDAGRAHYWWRTIFTPEDKRRVMDDAVAAGVDLDAFYAYDRNYAELRDASLQDQFLYADLQMFCIDNANMLLDSMSMAFSVEVRPPFLSKRFVEFAFRVPYQLKLRGSTTKYALRAAYSKRLPDYVTKLKKSGLVSPLAQLIRGPLRSLTETTFDEARHHESLNHSAIDELLREHLSGRKDHGYPLWVILNYLRWHQQFIANPSWRAPLRDAERTASQHVIDRACHGQLATGFSA